ncbi:MAG TPA: hypothetical protein PKH75_13980 [Bacillota bacterium]|nr:hypothetical protein [Bacillota bacterium]
MPQEYSQIRAEIATLEKMLMRLPESSIIDRMSLAARKKALEEELASWGVSEAVGCIREGDE